MEAAAGRDFSRSFRECATAVVRKKERTRETLAGGSDFWGAMVMKRCKDVIGLWDEGVEMMVRRYEEERVD